MKRGRCILITFLIGFFIGLVVLFSATKHVYAIQGEGTQDEPYQISTYEELMEFAQIVNGDHRTIKMDKSACAILMNDIQAWDSDWKPIRGYNGSFDGQGHTILGLKSDGKTTNGYYVGLFGSSFGTIGNVNMKEGDIRGNYYVGGVVGLNAGTVTNCSNKSPVSGTYHVGGVVGLNQGIVTNCNNFGDISPSKNTSGSYYIGGVVGNNDGITEDCHNRGTVSGGYYIGGVVGQNKTTISRCYSTGSISGGYYTGGVVGANTEGSTSNCYNTGSVAGGYYTGGVAGQNSDLILNCYSAGPVKGTSYVDIGGVVGSNAKGGTVIHAYFDINRGQCGLAIGENVGSEFDVKCLSTAEMNGRKSTTYDSWTNFYGVWTLTNGYPILDPHNHELIYSEYEKATCTTNGHISSYTCIVCQKHFMDEKGKKLIPDDIWILTEDHIWDRGRVTKEPTEWETGIRTLTCLTCGLTKKEMLPMIEPILKDYGDGGEKVDTGKNIHSEDRGDGGSKFDTDRNVHFEEHDDDGGKVDTIKNIPTGDRDPIDREVVMLLLALVGIATGLCARSNI